MFAHDAFWNNICNPYKPRQVFDEIINACRKDNKNISRLLIWGSRWKGSQMPKGVYQMSLVWCRQVGQLQSVTVEWTITGEMKLGKVDCTEANCHAFVVVMKQFGWKGGSAIVCERLLLWLWHEGNLGECEWLFIHRWGLRWLAPHLQSHSAPRLTCPSRNFWATSSASTAIPLCWLFPRERCEPTESVLFALDGLKKWGGWKKCVKCMCLAHSNSAQFFLGRPRNVKRRDLKHQWSCSWWRRQRYSFSGRRSRLLKGLSTDTAWQCNILHSSCACTVFRRILLWEYDVSFRNHLGAIVGTQLASPCLFSDSPAEVVLVRLGKWNVTMCCHVAREVQKLCWNGRREAGNAC